MILKYSVGNGVTQIRFSLYVKQWLKDRLLLEISEEKSKVVNLKKLYSEFLGFKLKVV